MTQPDEDATIPFAGFPGDPGKGGLVTDIDSYFKPGSDQSDKISLFVQNSFIRSKRLAVSFMQEFIGVSSNKGAK